MFDGIDLLLKYKNENWITIAPSDKDEEYLFCDRLEVTSTPVEDDNHDWGVQLRMSNRDDSESDGLSVDASSAFITLTVQEAEVLVLALKQQIEICKDANSEQEEPINNKVR